MSVGLILSTFFYFIKPYILVRVWWVFLFMSIGLLGYLVIMSWFGQAESIDVATRWLKLGGFQFQPSDFAKLSFVLFISAFLSNKKEEYNSFKDYFYQNLLPYGFWFYIILLLILLGKNLGTALVVGFVGLTCYGASITSKYHKRGFMMMLTLMAVGGVIFGLIESYRAERISVWTNYLKTNTTILPKEVAEGRRDESFQFDQVLTALGTGGISGVGVGESTGKYYFVKTTAGDDSIIGIIGEEWGFAATAGILLIYLYIILRSIQVGQRFLNKPIYFFLMIGCSSWIGFQAFVHFGANTGILPLTGQTLPFISLGGSSLISLLCAAGLLLNVSKQQDSVLNVNSTEAVKARPRRKLKKNL